MIAFDVEKKSKWKLSRSETNWVITNLWDQIRLQEKNFQLSAPILNVFNSFDVLLMQRNFLKTENEQLIVLRLLSQKLLSNWKKFMFSRFIEMETIESYFSPSFLDFHELPRSYERS